MIEAVQEFFRRLRGDSPELRRVINDHDPDGSPVMVVPDDHSVHDMSRYADKPPRYVAEDICLSDEQSFVDYVKRFQELGRTVVFMSDRRDPIFHAYIDYHAGEPIPTEVEGVNEAQPGRCKHVAVWNVKKHWRLEEWLQFANRYHGQIQFAKFIEEHANDVHVPKGAKKPVTPGQLIEVAKTFRAKRNVAFKSAVDTHNGDIEIGYAAKTSATAGANGKVTIPEEFVIALPIMEGSTSRVSITVRFGYRIDADDGSLTLGVDFLRLNDVLETAAEEIAESVREKLPESIPIYTGGRC